MSLCLHFPCFVPSFHMLSWHSSWKKYSLFEPDFCKFEACLVNVLDQLAVHSKTPFQKKDGVYTETAGCICFCNTLQACILDDLVKIHIDLETFLWKESWNSVQPNISNISLLTSLITEFLSFFSPHSIQIFSSDIFYAIANSYT